MSRKLSIAVVVGGGSIRPPDRHFDAVIVADSGLDVALAVGLVPTMLVGDLDSISPAGLQWASDHDVPIEQHPVDKNDTDTALALRCAIARGPTEVLVLGAQTTTRLDHLLGTLICLGDASLAAAETLAAHFGGTQVHVLHPGRTVTLTINAGSAFSLLALHGDCAGVGVTGARWSLSDAHLLAASTLGISNESLGQPVTISAGAGVLTVIVPEVTS